MVFKPLAGSRDGVLSHPDCQPHAPQLCHKRTAVLVPWDWLWQGMLRLAGLFAFALAVMGGAVEPMDLDRWMVLAAIGAFGLSFTAL